MGNISKLASQMKADWNRRIEHDHRFWMSDGIENDQVMWDSGLRDFNLILGNYNVGENDTVVEIGCGVGRLINAAAQKFKHVIGVDVSDAAIKKAKELLAANKDINLFVGSGVDLNPLETKSIDLVYSFAAITSVPTDVIAHYIVESNRVLKDGGRLHLQMYLGTEQQVGLTDTLHLRCFEEENFTAAMEAAGYSILEIKDLVLPFQVSFDELGIFAKLVYLEKKSACTATGDEISALLLPSGERTDSESDLESWMSINYAKTLIEAGDFDKARAALEYAVAVSRSSTIDISDLLQRITDKVGSKKEGAETTESKGVENNYFLANKEILAARFPKVLALLDSEQNTKNSVSSSQSQDGIVIFYDGQCLDHIDKPVAAAKAWAKRCFADPSVVGANHILVFGFGAGYHIEALQELSEKKISVIEPIPEVFNAAIRLRDLTHCLSQLSNVWIGTEGLEDIDCRDAELCIRAPSQVTASEYLTKLKSKIYGKRGVNTLRPSIAVLGPLQGGTLPITGYTTRALGALQQKTRILDMSGFATGYHLTTEFTKNPLRANSLQNTYVEFLSQVILEAANEKPFDILICMAQAPISARVLAELRSRGIITVLWFVEDYLRFTYWKDFAKFYDFIFTIQKGDCIDQIKQAGAGEVHYLPCAADPGIHMPLHLSPEEKARWGSPISFVGAGYHNRSQVFASMANMPFKIWGTEWPGNRPFDKLVQEEGRRLTPEEYIKIFNATEINLNLHSSSERDGVDPFGDFVNPRTFELAAAGAFQLADERSLLSELFVPGEEIVTFSNTQDMKDKIGYYLAHPDERIKITAKARARIFREHTYQHRLDTMLSLIYQSRYQQLSGKEKIRPWAKLLDRSKSDPELHSRCNVAYERGEEPILDGLVSDVTAGNGKLTETEQKLMFLYHVRKQIIMMKSEEGLK